MARWSDEVEAGMDTSVSNLEPLHPGLSLQVGIKLVLDIVNYRSPTLGVVNSFSKSRGVNHCQRELDAILNQYSENKEGIFLRNFVSDCWFEQNYQDKKSEKLQEVKLKLLRLKTINFV